jgi:uncharacterized metal-binding protein
MTGEGPVGNDAPRVLVIPCSGIGKVHGLLSREATYLVVDELAPQKTDVVCLALLVKRDEEALGKIKTHVCVAIDGCGKACAEKNIEIAGGQVAAAFRVDRALMKHRGARPGDGSDLTDEGWEICRELADEVAEAAGQLAAERLVAGQGAPS